jgi:hypothetical protein
MTQSIDQGTNQAGTATNLPPFYRDPVPLEPKRHARFGIRPRTGYGFARDTNGIMLTGSEMALAARTYPIAFAGTERTIPFAIVGLRDKENLFVDAEGKWRDDAYVPAYVRRYPFIFSETPSENRLLLCVDEAAEAIERESQQPLFVDDKPSPALTEILRFCESFQVQYEDTRKFGEWLDGSGLLEERTARAELPTGQVLTMSGFRLINPEKLRSLTDPQVLELHKRGWLPLLHFHLQSLANWGLLNALTVAKQRQAAA